MIKANSHKYSVSAMCKVLKLNRSTYYYEAKAKEDESNLISCIREIFRASRNNYGTRKIKHMLAKEDLIVSRRRIVRIMKQEGLVSNYTVAQFKPHVDKCNESKIANRVNREIIGYSAGRNKDASLVIKAFSTVEANLEHIKIFHTDRGNEFKNKMIEETLEAFNIQRSLSMKGCPYDNAVAEATYKIIKTEFVRKNVFSSLEELQYELSDYVNWFNNHRIHSALNYLTPSEARTSKHP